MSGFVRALGVAFAAPAFDVELGTGRRLRSALVMAKMALSFVLLVGGGLMVRSFVALSHVDPGYDATGLLTFTVGFRNGQRVGE